mmetsp:Transcript_41299/g.58107  ORF Transcript_41299/g.58107 Transcript_41299/m.58107 type:complete len:122 (+) Transcript_41299:188-553(+)
MTAKVTKLANTPDCGCFVRHSAPDFLREQSVGCFVGSSGCLSSDLGQIAVHVVVLDSAHLVGLNLVAAAKAGWIEGVMQHEVVASAYHLHQKRIGVLPEPSEPCCLGLGSGPIQAEEVEPS